MSIDEQISLTAMALAFGASLNWAAGQRSLLGRPLALRTSHTWIAMRWLGLGLFSACLILGTTCAPEAPWVALVSALILLLGTARTRVTEPAPIPGPEALDPWERVR